MTHEANLQDGPGLAMPRAMMRRLLDPVLDVFWPRHCVVCDLPGAGDLLCEGCLATLVPATGACCPRCGLPYLDPSPGGGRHVCGVCLKDPPPWERARAAWAYGGALQDVVARWKNAPDHSVGPGLGRLLVQAAGPAGWRDLPPRTRVVPVPAHARRLRRRGFNPAGLLARTLAKELGLELAPLGLRARREPPASKGMRREARARRLQGVFRGQPPAVAGRPILLVDDVMTTGATARAAAKACRRAGAEQVEVAVLARVPKS